MLFTDKKQVTLAILKQAGIALAAVFLALIIIIIASRNIVRISDTLAQNEKLAAVLARRTETAQELKGALTVIGNNDERIKNAYPPVDNILDFVGALESVASQNSLSESIRFGEPAPASDLSDSQLLLLRTDYGVSLNGTVVTLINYLKQFEALPYLTYISSVNVVSPADLGWGGNSLINISATLYVK